LKQVNVIGCMLMLHVISNGCDQKMRQNKLFFYRKEAVVFISFSLVFASFGIAIASENQSSQTKESNFSITWDVQLNFNEPGGAFDYVVFGEAPDANDGPPHDSYDEPKPPAPQPPFIRSWFNDYLPEPYNILWRDYRHYPDTSKQWNLTVQWFPTDYVTPTTITISWITAEVDESEYNIVKFCNSGGTQLKDMLTENSYSFTCPALVPQIFYIICQANNTPPNQPSSPTPANGATNVGINADLSWICSDPDGDPLTYDVYFGTSSSPPIVVSNQSSTTYDPGTMNYNTVYYWRIVAWDTHGASTSGPVWHFTTEAGTPPGNPSNLNAQNPTSTSIYLTWTKGSGSDKTVIRAKTSGYPTSPDDGISVYNGTGTSTTHSSLSSGQIYFYRAWAYDSVTGLFSTGYAQDSEYTKPGDPSNLAIVGVTRTTISLTWTKGTGGDRTMIRRSTGTYPSTPSSGVEAYFGTGTSCTDTGLTPGTTYYYRAWAYDSDSTYYSDGYTQISGSTSSNNPPNAPSNPSPANGATNVDVNASLSWTCSDPDGDPLTYDIYFGTSSSPPLVQSNWASTTYSPGTMSYNTVYYWRIVAEDNYGASTSGPVWHFTTTSLPNNPPNPPSNPSPTNGSTNVDINADLSWTCTDPDGDPLTYDVYFGTNSNPPLVSSGQSASSYDPGTMSYGTTYYWRIVAEDNHGASTSGPIWHFTTKINNPPNPPSNPNPPNGATNVGINADLSWTCTDPDGHPLTYDVYFEENDPTPDIIVSHNQSSSTYDPGIMSTSTHYYWMIVAWDNQGASTSGPVWDFTTVQNNPPNTPGAPSGPPNGKVKVSYTYTAVTTDPDGDQIYYEFDWGDGTNSGWVGPFDSGEEGSASHSWLKGTYSIRVKAKDIHDAESGWSANLSVKIPRTDAKSRNLDRIKQFLQQLRLFKSTIFDRHIQKISALIHNGQIFVNPLLFLRTYRGGYIFVDPVNVLKMMGGGNQKLNRL
jgi:hypothetical protein